MTVCIVALYGNGRGSNANTEMKRFKGGDMLGIDSVKGLFPKNQDVLDIEPAEPKLGKEHARRFSARNRGSVRLSLGLFYTKEEWQKRRAKLLKKRLP